MWPSTPQPDTTRGAEAAFQPYDIVALTRAWEGVPPGQWGTVIEAFEDASCEVEFTDREGHTLQVGRVPFDMLELVWSEE